MKKIYLTLAFMLVSLAMSATSYKGVIYKDSTMRAYLPTLPYGEDGSYEVTVKVSDDKSTITILNWTGTTGDDVSFTFGADGTVYAVDGKSLPDDDGYYSTWVNTGGLSEGGYYGIYVYGGLCASGTWADTPNSYVKINEDGSGEGYFRVISYEVSSSGANRHVYFKWTTEQVEEIAETEYPLLVTKDEGYPFTALPYNENGEYLAKVCVPSTLAYITIKNWTGEADGSGESLKIYINPDDGIPSSINGKTDYCYPGLGSQKDGDYSYCAAMAGAGCIEFTADDGSEGDGYIELYQYNTSSYTWFDFSWPGELSPTGIKTVDADAVSKNAPSYNAVGQRVNANTKGLVIRGGKKYINK